MRRGTRGSFCEPGIEPTVSVKGGDIFDLLSYHQLIRKILLHGLNFLDTKVDKI
jgi:hypothetical protein